MQEESQVILPTETNSNQNNNSSPVFPEEVKKEKVSNVIQKKEDYKLPPKSNNSLIYLTLIFVVLVIFGFLGWKYVFGGKIQESFFSTPTPTIQIVTTPTSVISTPTIQPTVASDSAIAPTQTANEMWILYEGETMYTTDGTSKFKIEYPTNWSLEKNTLYPEGKGDGNQIKPSLILGAGGHGLDPSTTENEEKTYPAGKATVFKNKVIGESNFLIASFNTEKITYIFEFKNIPKEKIEDYKNIFEKMLSTLKIL